MIRGPLLLLLSGRIFKRSLNFLQNGFQRIYDSKSLSNRTVCL